MIASKAKTLLPTEARFLLAADALRERISHGRLSGSRAPVAIRRLIWSHYSEFGRSFPWRLTRDPYKILISEIMLQQTQTHRVQPKYQAFLQRFPTVAALSRATFREVLEVWQGLGYNRRALYLHELSVQVMEEYAGQVPTDVEALRQLRGIGRYTAAAVSVFCEDRAAVLVETNIRAVCLFFLFSTLDAVHDRDIEAVAARLLDRKKPREWNYAMMDFGALLKRAGRARNSQSAHHRPQSRFEGSDRQLRGAVLRYLCAEGAAGADALRRSLNADRARLGRILDVLLTERLITKGQNSTYRIG